MGRTPPGVDSGEAVTVMNKDLRRITDVYFSLPLFVNAMIIATLGTVQLWLINPVTRLSPSSGTIIVVSVIAWYSTFLESKIGGIPRKGQRSLLTRLRHRATGLRTIAGLGAEEQMRELPPRHRRSLRQLHALRKTPLDVPSSVRCSAAP